MTLKIFTKKNNNILTLEIQQFWSKRFLQKLLILFRVLNLLLHPVFYNSMKNTLWMTLNSWAKVYSITTHLFNFIIYLSLNTLKDSAPESFERSSNWMNRVWDNLLWALQFARVASDSLEMQIEGQYISITGSYK